MYIQEKRILCTGHTPHNVSVVSEGERQAEGLGGECKSKGCEIEQEEVEN